MKNILLIGIGGTGSEAADILDKKIKELGQQSDNNIATIVLDTDTGDIANIKNAVTISMADNGSVGNICDTIGREYIREWFPCEDPNVRSQEMIKGAAQWRKKSYLAFLNAMNKPASRKAFISALERMTIDPNAACEVYIIASIAGGTGSGTFIPLALFVRHYLRRQLQRNPLIYAMLALPDIYADQQIRDNKIKVYANAYAILRELNAINLVTRGYNAGTKDEKRTPIKFKIGNPEEPNVGLLFDSEDKQYWTPEAAPFNQIFLLDRIPNVNSVKAHNIVLANSLYTLLCTEIGAKFDSEASNHELLRSQNNGSNAIFAGISTSQINFPIESILNYLAYSKTVDSCENEWLIIHRETEKEIKQKEQSYKDSGQRFKLDIDEYAEMFLSQLQNEAEKTNPSPIVQIIEEDTTRYNSDGTKVNDPIKKYVDNLNHNITNRLPSTKPVITRIKEVIEQAKSEKEIGYAEINDVANTISSELNRYYKKCIVEIRKNSRIINENILSFDPKELNALDDNLSLIKNVICKSPDLTFDKKYKYIHPVSALTQLCKLMGKVQERIIKYKNLLQWTEIKRGEPTSVKSSLLGLNERNEGKLGSKSIYLGAKEERLLNLLDPEQRDSMYETVSENKSKMKKYNYAADLDFIESDVNEVVETVKNACVSQLNKLVFENLSPSIKLLIEKYRVFFSRFTKEKEDLIEETKSAKRMDSGINDSVINVYSTEEEKEAIKNKIFSSTPNTSEQIEAANNIAGKGVFETVFASAAASNNSKEWNDRDSSSYKLLFANMVNAYKQEISKYEAFENLARCSVIEAMVESAEDSNDFYKLEELFRQYFSKAQKLATPSLRVSTKNNNDLIEPSYILVFMLSYDTAKYIKKNADKFKLSLPSDQSNEEFIISSCAEQFVHRYANNNNVRVVIVKSIASKVLYCTGEIMDITPLRIEKFDELSEDSVYFNNYLKAIEKFKVHETEMWNPHIGNNLHKRGYLPYMNKEMETICDRKMIKALLFGLANNGITYYEGLSKDVRTFKYQFGARKGQIKTDTGEIVTKETLSRLLQWIRNEDEIIEGWSKEFDLDIAKQKAEFPFVSGQADVKNLETKITQTRFLNQLTKLLFEIKDGNTTQKFNIFSFADKIRSSEESSLDCDDAERIIKVAYEVFLELIEYRAPRNQPDVFERIYNHEVDTKIYPSITNYAEEKAKKTKNNNKSDSKEEFTEEYQSLCRQLLDWIYDTGSFMRVSSDIPTDVNGDVIIDQRLTFNDIQSMKNSKDKKGLSKDDDVIDTEEENIDTNK